jgi:hypothetical protein
MTANLEIIIYEKADALMVPLGAVRGKWQAVCAAQKG